MSKFTRRALNELFATTCKVMGWSTKVFDENNKSILGAYRLDYYGIAGGYQIVQITTAGGGEGKLLFNRRLTINEMRIALETMCWTRGYDLAQFNVTSRPDAETTLGGWQYWEGQRQGDVVYHAGRKA
jgi:hypothetical protein